MRGLRELGSREGDAGRVLSTDAGYLTAEQVERPGDVQGGIVPQDGAFAGRIVEIGRLVENFGCLRNDQKTVGEALRDPQQIQIAGLREGLEIEGRPSAEFGRVAAQIDGDIPDMPRKHPNQLSLGPAELVVKTTENAPAGAGLIVLGEAGRQTGRGEPFGIEDLGKPSAIVAEALRAEALDIGQGCVEDLHPGHSKGNEGSLERRDLPRKRHISRGHVGSRKVD